MQLHTPYPGKRSADRDEENMEHFTLPAADGHRIHGCCWQPPATQAVRAVVLICHGMSEHAARYQPLALQLAERGIAVYAHDHRGHGPHAAHHGWFAAADGWDKVVADVDSVRQYIASHHPGLPLILLGHSMGSFIARQYFLQHGAQLAGLVLSATGYRQRPLAWVLRQLARLAGKLGGANLPSAFMARLIFGSFNLGFFPARTRVDWLSRDTAQVAAYQADPLCGFDPTPGLWADLFGGIMALEQGEADARSSLPRACPVYLLAGSRDPVSLGRLALGQLEIRYRDAGLQDVSSKVYPGGRHEMFNETNREQVVADLQIWLERVLKAVQGGTG
ncbi:alpha/beta hydrolase [Aquitalea denitrificans]|uniref:alpha/beta hydrolase n=1 Tax=Aquitalea denitrificans TaxID=519081 RepID=UPI001F10CC08|nr:alpha/beta hydrolase [Aquitalea denitrificans]